LDTCSNTGKQKTRYSTDVRFTGPDVLRFLHRLVPADLDLLEPYQSTLSILMNEKGGIIDDLMITKMSPKEFFVVTNATRREADIAHFKDHFAGHDDLVQHDLLDDHGLIALQGPSSSQILQKLTSFDLNTVKFNRSVNTTILGVENVLVSRGGYTGEDGFEISIPGDKETEAISQAFMESEDVKLAGLAARDSLRLEAGLCLYGHDLNEITHPIEAGLKWLLRSSRTGYLGYDTVTAHGENPQHRNLRRLGFIVEDAPARGYSRVNRADCRGGPDIFD
jgi:aminomethyltransferase